MCVPHPGMCTRRLPYWLTHSRDILLTEYVQKVLGKWILPSDSTFFLSLLLFWILFHSLLFNYPSNKYLKGDFMPGIFLGSKFMLNCNCTFHSTRMAGATLWNHFFFTPSLQVGLFSHSFRNGSLLFCSQLHLVSFSMCLYYFHTRKTIWFETWSLKHTYLMISISILMG